MARSRCASSQPSVLESSRRGNPGMLAKQTVSAKQNGSQCWFLTLLVPKFGGNFCPQHKFWNILRKAMP